MRETIVQTGHWKSLDKAHHLHSFTDPQTILAEGSRVIVRGEGSYIWDSDGRKILDGMAGLWCVNVGYGRQALSQAAARQMNELAFYSNHFQSTTPHQVELAKRLAGLTPEGIDYFAFSNSGSEANDTMIRLVRRYWALKGAPERRVIIGRHLGYHGSTLAASSLGGMAPMHAMDHAILPDFAHIITPHWYTQGNDLGLEEFGLKAARALEEKILELGAERVAAFVGEPIQGAGGVIPPPPNYWAEIQRICKKYGILLVADEVICGFGRTGHMFGLELFNIQPDMMVMAKGLSSGYVPIAATGMSQEIFSTLSSGGVLSHGFTYSGHPVACAVALENLNIIEREELVSRVAQDVGPYLRKCLREAVEPNGLIGEVRGAGLMWALQIVSNQATREMFDAEQKPAILCREHAYAAGLVIRAVGHAMVLSPPLTISRSEIDEMVDKIAKALALTAQDLGRA